MAATLTTASSLANCPKDVFNDLRRRANWLTTNERSRMAALVRDR
jgi:hypothetical protein